MRTLLSWVVSDFEISKLDMLSHRALWPTCLAGIQEIADDIDALVSTKDRPSGTVRLTVSDHAFDTVVWPKLRPLLANYKESHLEFSIDNGLINIVQERFDAGIRLGENLEKDMLAVRISPDWRLVVVGSPDYFRRNETPTTPHELVRHNCINDRQGRNGGLYA
jgi:DNA-binding transcriptional LysR family regulator